MSVALPVEFLIHLFMTHDVNTQYAVLPLIFAALVTDADGVVIEIPL